MDKRFISPFLARSIVEPIIIVLLSIAVLLAAAVGVVLFLRKRNQRRRAKERAQRDAPAEYPTHKDQPRHRDPEQLGYKDRVEIGEVTYVVKGSILLTAGGYTWREFWMETPSSRVWLSVERDPKLEVVHWKEIETDLKPGNKTLTYNDQAFKLDEKGSAEYTALGTTGLPGKGKMKYYDYTGPYDEKLSFEKFDDGEWEAAEGFLLPEEMYSIYPHSGASA